jgi:hypothetical protein
MSEDPIPTDPQAKLTRKKLAAALTTAGFKTAPQTLATLASRGGGPPYRVWGRFAVYEWGDGLKWAEAMLKAERRTASEGRTAEEAEKVARAAQAARETKAALAAQSKAGRRKSSAALAKEWAARPASRPARA